MSNTNALNNWWETEVGSNVVAKKYFHDGEGFDAFASRVAGVFSDDGLRGDVEKALKDGDFFVAGRSLYALGCKGKFRASTSNCYILPMPEDNTDSINANIAMMENIFKAGGGVGVNISNLRPNGSKVMNAARTSTGAVSFMKKYDASASVIGANNRRAALLIGLNCDHPDIEEFLEVKRNNTDIQNANISILFTDEFMAAVESGSEYTLSFTVQATGEVIEKTINAKEFFIKFCAAQWDYAEPGALYIDTIRSNNLMSGYPKEEYNIDICNPCAEYVGSANNACNLASINLYNVVSAPFTDNAAIDWKHLANLVRLGVRALDEILDYGLNLQPLPENRQAVIDYRAIGLGVFGLADMLVALGVRYGSEESIDILSTIMLKIQWTAIKTSVELAKEKGSFAKYDFDYIKKSKMFKVLPSNLQCLIEHYGLRNASLLAIAPTGSIATMCGLSGGVEPYYQVSYERSTHALEKQGVYFKVFAKAVEHLLDAYGIDKETMDNNAIKQRFPFVVDAHDIAPTERIAMQAAMQKYVDNAISSTLNLKESATVQDIYNAYIQAWKGGCKGLTVFRENCQRTAIMGGPKKTEVSTFDTVSPVKRKDIGVANGMTLLKHTACSPNMYITVNSKDGNVLEVFTNTSTGCQSNVNTITRMASLALRSGVKVKHVVKELRSNTCSACTTAKVKGEQGLSVSCGAAIAEAIEEVYNGNTGVDTVSGSTELGQCPACGKSTLPKYAKCPTCNSCGWSKCE